MRNDVTVNKDEFIHTKIAELKKNNSIDASFYDKAYVKRGLRNADGTGVVAGLTQICDVRGYYMEEGEKMPTEGKLIYRGINVQDIVDGFNAENRFGYEETAYLLLFGKLPNRQELPMFNLILAENRSLPPRFTEDMILSAPSRDIMNKLSRSMLAMYSYDPDPEPRGIEKEILQALQIIARCPVIVAHAYAAKKHYFDNESLYLHRPQDNLSLAENFLYSIRRDNKFTSEEAHLLDLCLVLHAEHGGGNNSAFSCRVLSSTGTDIYSALAAAIGSLKGPRHGGANMKVMEMFEYIQKEVSDWHDEEAVRDYLKKLLSKQAGDRSGLIYGIGHAVYTMSDPRAVILRRFARKLAQEKGLLDEFELIETVDRLSPGIFQEVRGMDPKNMSANVDMYSGFVYRMLGIPEELYTPLFAIARMVGWCAHRIEEVYNPNKIIRPAYKAVSPHLDFVPLAERE